MEEKDLQEKKEAALKEIQNVATEAANKKVEELKEEFAKFATKEDAEKANQELNEKLSKLGAEQKKQSQISKVDKTMNKEQAMKKGFADAIISNQAAVKAYRKGDTVELTSKLLEDTNFGALGTDYKDLTTDRQGLYKSPYAPIWLRNIFPNSTTNGSSIKYLRRIASTGAAAVWEKGTKKPDVTPNFEIQTADVEWIAGLTDVHRDMIQDTDFLASFIPDNLLYSASGLFAAENKYIMDYIEDSANHTAFTGEADYGIGLEKVIAAAFGDIGGAYMQPTHILINNWDYLTYLAFNKASGSGEYDQVFTLNGQLYINQLQAVPVPTITKGEAYVVAAGESQFVSRMSPEVRMSEENKDNFEKNLITFRAEERIAFYTKDAKSIIKVLLPDTTGE